MIRFILWEHLRGGAQCALWAGEPGPGQDAQWLQMCRRMARRHFLETGNATEVEIVTPTRTVRMDCYGIYPA